MDSSVWSYCVTVKQLDNVISYDNVFTLQRVVFGFGTLESST